MIINFTKTIIFAVLLFQLFTGCETNPPNANSETDLNFSFLITSNIPGAKIFVDGIDVNKTTPDTVTLLAGTHNVSVELEDYNKVSRTVSTDEITDFELEFVLTPINLLKTVIMEDFANVSCVPCVTSNKIIEQLANHTYGRNRVAVIKYPTNFPFPNDPFYLHAGSFADDRISYYNILAAPTIVIDGIQKPLSLDSNDIKNSIDERMLLTSKFTLSVDDSLQGDQIFANVKIIYWGGIDDASNLLLRTVITETNIIFEEPPGSNGETIFHDVMRRILVPESPINFSMLQSDIPTEIKLSTTISSSWNRENLNVVVFIQDAVTKEVYQAASTY
ncbi:MAG: Omp28-related outer membrane protein [Melioribacteraceae bacterium]|nr:Omp28-related outer membrane protein [Melioribacteraceae bacterium]MCF8353235.1 Omp28-related outer membrane protein [Melioribacteraceae bacterium]MCF8393967.1 Omp28-related outer membrane protein [Melioribacteraceae bacterium]MCF8418731.1 Omp28-related outer membrane protein [Melioribacteraceae bacterium]